MTSGIANAAVGLGGGGDSKGQLSSTNKFSTTDRQNMRPYQTAQNFGSKDIDGAGGFE